jgi:Uma2 family endonuclease
MPSGEHEMIKSIWRCLVETLAEEMNLPLRSAGSMTQKWQAHEREIEADECFYIKSWPKIRGKRQFVPGVDPFSDLALEVDVTSLSIARLPIYASLRVPEVWRFEGESIHVLLLNDRGDYEESEYSPTFSGVSIAGLVPFLLMWDEDLFTIVRAFRAWLGQQLSRPKKKGKQPRRRKDT